MNHADIILASAGAVAFVALALGGMIYAVSHRE